MEEQIDDVDYNEIIDDLDEELINKKKKKKANVKAQMTENNPKFIDIEDRERLLLSQLLNNSEIFIKAIAFLDKNFFETKINKLIVTFMINYYNLYKSVPPSDAILMELNLDDTRADWLDIKSQWPTKYLEDYLNSFIKNMSMKGAIEDSIELLEQEDYGTIEKKIKDAVSIDIDTTLGVTVDSSKETFRDVFKMLTSTEQTIPTGWDNIDKELDGGVTVPSLNYLLAKSGGGKSIGLINLSWNYVKQGKDVIYISLELKEAKIMKRYITHATKIPTFDIPKREADIFTHLKKCDEKGYGRFTIQFYQPNSLTAIKLELFVRNYIQKYGTVPIIIVDYAGLMTPNGKGWQGMFERDKYVSEELRGVATLFDTVIWTADQYNRSVCLHSKVQTQRGEIEIKDITTNDYVLTHSQRMTKVNVVHEIQEQECYEITLKSGKTIICSGRHMWPKADPRKVESFENKIIDNINTSLKVGDKLWIESENDKSFYNEKGLVKS